MSLYEKIMGILFEKKLLKQLNELVEPFCLKCDARCCKGKLTGALVLKPGEEKLFKGLEISDTLIKNSKKPYLLKEKYYSLILPNNESCPFLKNRLCSSHKNRPYACRYYPFYIESDCLFIREGCIASKNKDFVSKVKAFADKHNKEFAIVEIVN